MPVGAVIFNVLTIMSVPAFESITLAPVVRFSVPIVGESVRSIGTPPLTVIAPLFASPIFNVPAVTRSISASVRLSGPTLGSVAAPRLMATPIVFCLSVTGPLPALMFPAVVWIDIESPINVTAAFEPEAILQPEPQP